MAAKTHLIVGMPYGCAFAGPGDGEHFYETLAEKGAALGRLASRDVVEGPNAQTYPLWRVGDGADRYDCDDRFEDVNRTEPSTVASLVRELGGRAVVVTDGAHRHPRAVGGTPVKVELIGFPAGATPAVVLAAAGVDPAAMAGGWVAWLGDPATADFGDDDNDTRVETLLRIWRAAAAL